MVLVPCPTNPSNLRMSQADPRTKSPASHPSPAGTFCTLWYISLPPTTGQLAAPLRTNLQPLATYLRRPPSALPEHNQPPYYIPETPLGATTAKQGAKRQEPPDLNAPSSNTAPHSYILDSAAFPTHLSKPLPNMSPSNGRTLMATGAPSPITHAGPLSIRVTSNPLPPSAAHSDPHSPLAPSTTIRVNHKITTPHLCHDLLSLPQLSSRDDTLFKGRHAFICSQLPAPRARPSSPLRPSTGASITSMATRFLTLQIFSQNFPISFLNANPASLTPSPHSTPSDLPT